MEYLIEIRRGIEDINPAPAFVLIDLQSVKAVSATDQRGIDAGKKLRVVSDT